MAKKSFKDNPAMQFISTVENNDENKNPETTKKCELKKEEKAKIESMSMKRSPIYTETRSKRFNLLIQPSLHSKLQIKANKEKVSINELINSILDDYINRGDE